MKPIDASTRERCNAIFAELGEDFPLAELPIPSRLRNALRWARLETSLDVLSYIRWRQDVCSALMLLPNIGPKTIEEFVENYGAWAHSEADAKMGALQRLSHGRR